MPSPAEKSRVVHFGLFEVDLQEQELRKSGIRIKLQEQPFQILAVLLEHPGQTVTREELRQKLWPTDTFVDFDHSLNSSVKKLRLALADDSDNPRFIETLHRRGYRFIAPVDSSPAPVQEPALPASVAYTPVPTHENRSHAKALVGLVAVLTSLAVLLVAFNVGHSRDRLLGRTAPRIESLAVLPLANLSGDPRQDYFADGMTEELITTVGKLGALRVISRTSVMRYKNTDKPLPQIAKELDVDAVIEGSATRVGGRVRITAQLIQASTDRQLWAETYDRDLRDIFAVQSEVAQSIANEVEVKLTPQEQTRLKSGRPVNPEAYEAYLRGRHFWALDQGGLEYFEKATQIDPGFAPAYAGMALNYTVQGFSRPPREVSGKAMEAAIKALQLDPELAEAHAALGYAKLNYEWDWVGAESEFRKAIELNPGSSDAHWMYAVYLTVMMRFDEATSEAQQAHQLDPFSPTINDLIGWVLMYERRYGDAIAQFKRALELAPGYRLSHSWLAACYISKRMYPEARGELDELGLPADDPSRGVIDWLTGNKKQALKCAESLKRRAQHEYVDPFYVALFYSGLGDKDAAFAWLEKGFEGRSANMPQMNIEPGFDLLRSDPRFRDLLLRMNFPQ